jgi:hypothetical protein
MLINKDIYFKNPAENVIANNGVANVTDDLSDASLKTLRYEVETFVCDGQYSKGLEKILETYLKNISSPEQPGVWISGFFGSGKSHLAKMLRALWIDFAFLEDGASSRALAKLPTSVADLLKELSTQGKRLGGLHAASGTLGSGAGDNVRLALLGIVFKSVGLPEQYHVARFEMRLKEVGIFDRVKAYIEANGKEWTKERDHIYNSPLVVEGLLKAWPEFADTTQAAKEQLRAEYKKVTDVTNDEMITAINDALSVEGKLPLTVIILDEVQQFIGNNIDRGYIIQEVTEACCKKLKGKLLFIGTGQTALSGTVNLQRLMARFPIPIELSDTDVETVIRKIILVKKPGCVTEIEKTMTTCLGEISRHLSGTKIEHRTDDTKAFVQDYPILPVRRRFWEKVLRIVDATGTVSQLRNQLKIVHEATISTLDRPIGHVVPGDFIYSQISSSLLQTAVISKELYENIQRLSGGTDDDKLMARLCGLIFLVGKLPRDGVADIGLRATSEALADLLVEDITSGSADLRKRIPALLKQMEDDGLVMPIENEYRLQTRESSAWHDEYRKQLSELTSNPARIDDERVTIFRKSCGEALKTVRLTQGNCKESRTFSLQYSTELPTDANKKIYAWIRDGWETDEKSVLADVRNAGNQSPTIFVYIPRHAADELNKTLIGMLAAQATLNVRGTPSTPEGEDARSAMSTRLNNAQRHLNALTKEILANARVFQGGGNEIVENTLTDQVNMAATNSLIRLYPQFDLADHAQWAKVFDNAKKGAGDALLAVGHKDEPAKHPVCAAILKFIAGGKKGSEIRDNFKDPLYGWPQDAIDGGLFALLAGGLIRANDATNKTVDVKTLERAKITQTTFKVESVHVTPVQLIQVRKVLQEAGCPCKPGEELASIPTFVQSMLQRAQAAGGEPPCPPRPSTTHLDEIKSLTGNEQIMAIYNQRDDLLKQVKEWDERAAAIQKRRIDWTILEELLNLATGLGPAEKLKEHAQAIKASRLLLAEPNPMLELIEQATQLLRKALNHSHEEYQKVYDAHMSQLQQDTNWQKLDKEQRQPILANANIAAVPAIATGSVDEIIESLEKMSLDIWRYRREALPSLFEQARLEAAKLLEPKVVHVNLPHRTIKTADEANAWLKEVKVLFDEKLKDGPVMV